MRSSTCSTAAHERGIVHRDLKPANLLVTCEGELKVLDFGIARLRDERGGGGTATGAMLGTPAFMAPEQAHGKTNEIDAQTDLWAVGATLYTLLSGALVHDGDNAQQLLIAAATKPAPLALERRAPRAAGGRGGRRSRARVREGRSLAERDRDARGAAGRERDRARHANPAAREAREALQA